MAPDLAGPLLWQRLDVPGLEHFRLEADAAGPRLAGTVLATHDGTPLRLEYEIVRCATRPRVSSRVSVSPPLESRGHEPQADRREDQDDESARPEHRPPQPLDA